MNPLIDESLFGTPDIFEGTPATPTQALSEMNDAYNNQPAPVVEVQSTPVPESNVLPSLQSSEKIEARPTDRDLLKYHASYIPKMISYFKSRDLYEETEDIMTWKNGELHKIPAQKPNAPPSFAEFASDIGVSEKALIKWARYIPDFQDAYEMCESITKKFFIEHGITGRYNSAFGIFAAKNMTDMKDKIINENRNFNMNDLLDDIEKNEKPLFE